MSLSFIALDLVLHIAAEERAARTIASPCSNDDYRLAPTAELGRQDASATGFERRRSVARSHRMDFPKQGDHHSTRAAC